VNQHGNWFFSLQKKTKKKKYKKNRPNESFSSRLGTCRARGQAHMHDLVFLRGWMHDLRIFFF